MAALYFVDELMPVMTVIMFLQKAFSRPT